MPVDLVRRAHGQDGGGQEHLPKCHQVPPLTAIAINNKHWQVVPMADFEVYLYSAHYEDERYPEEGGKAAVRILALINRSGSPFNFQTHSCTHPTGSSYSFFPTGHVPRSKTWAVYCGTEMSIGKCPKSFLSLKVFAAGGAPTWTANTTPSS